MTPSPSSVDTGIDNAIAATRMSRSLKVLMAAVLVLICVSFGASPYQDLRHQASVHDALVVAMRAQGLALVSEPDQTTDALRRARSYAAVRSAVAALTTCQTASYVALPYNVLPQWKPILQWRTTPFTLRLDPSHPAFNAIGCGSFTEHITVYDDGK